MSHPTPILPFTKSDYEDIYEPAEDTFLLLDTLEADAPSLRSLFASPLILEIGPGSGCALTFISKLLNGFAIGADINPLACKATLKTAQANDIIADALQMDLVSGFRSGANFDIIMFNPPYVPTDEEELEHRSGIIQASWAGGMDGMQITNRVLPLIPALLSARGVFYLVAVQENKPLDIIEAMAGFGLKGEIRAKRRAGGELLYILRFEKQISEDIS